ncbi:acyl-homoserine-lactone synthase [Agrobacterium tumefaciens]|uniref:acyl-homoserine-lactone synthase n=1 Tax=Agrobacterium tumefaciens TaxID=358 RepID=UPI0027E477D6|nr:acyl-homoserine-lactone synthase [Agrobacterium tumefaciens]
MFAGIVEWSILNGYREIVTATEVRLERILRRAGCPLSRLGAPAQINETRSVAGLLPADWVSFDRLCPSTYAQASRVEKTYETLKTAVQALQEKGQLAGMSKEIISVHLGVIRAAVRPARPGIFPSAYCKRPPTSTHSH